jgi:hypothetical protein
MPGGKGGARRFTMSVRNDPTETLVPLLNGLLVARAAVRLHGLVIRIPRTEIFSDTWTTALIFTRIEVQTGFLSISLEAFRGRGYWIQVNCHPGFIADSIDRRQIYGMLRAISNNIKEVIWCLQRYWRKVF